MSSTYGQQTPGGYPPAAGGYPPPGAAGYPPAAPPRRRRGWIFGYGIAVLLIVAGVISIVLGVSSFSGAVNSLARVSLPAGGTVTLSHAGGNVVYYESSTGSSGAVPPIDLHIAPASAGAKVTGLRQYGSGSSSTYSLNSRHGVAVFTLQVVHPGRFRVWDTAPAGAAGGSLAIGGSVAGHLLVGLLLGILLVLAGIAGLVVTTIVLIIRRVRARPVPQPAYPQGPRP